MTTYRITRPVPSTFGLLGPADYDPAFDLAPDYDDYLTMLDREMADADAAEPVSEQTYDKHLADYEAARQFA